MPTEYHEAPRFKLQSYGLPPDELLARLRLLKDDLATSDKAKLSPSNITSTNTNVNSNANNNAATPTDITSNTQAEKLLEPPIANEEWEFAHHSIKVADGVVEKHTAWLKEIEKWRDYNGREMNTYKNNYMHNAHYSNNMLESSWKAHRETEATKFPTELKTNLTALLTKFQISTNMLDLAIPYESSTESSVRLEFTNENVIYYFMEDKRNARIISNYLCKRELELALIQSRNQAILLEYTTWAGKLFQILADNRTNRPRRVAFHSYKEVIEELFNVLNQSNNMYINLYLNTQASFGNKRLLIEVLEKICGIDQQQKAVDESRLTQISTVLFGFLCNQLDKPPEDPFNVSLVLLLMMELDIMTAAIRRSEEKQALLEKIQVLVAHFEENKELNLSLRFFDQLAEIQKTSDEEVVFLKQQFGNHLYSLRYTNSKPNEDIAYLKDTLDKENTESVTARVEQKLQTIQANTSIAGLIIYRQKLYDQLLPQQQVTNTQEQQIQSLSQQ